MGLEGFRHKKINVSKTFKACLGEGTSKNITKIKEREKCKIHKLINTGLSGG